MLAIGVAPRKVAFDAVAWPDGRVPSAGHPKRCSGLSGFAPQAAPARTIAAVACTAPRWLGRRARTLGVRRIATGHGLGRLSCSATFRAPAYVGTRRDPRERSHVGHRGSLSASRFCGPAQDVQARGDRAAARSGRCGGAVAARCAPGDRRAHGRIGWRDRQPDDPPGAGASAAGVWRPNDRGGIQLATRPLRRDAAPRSRCKSAVSVIVADVEAVDVRRMRLVLGLAAG